MTLNFLFILAQTEPATTPATTPASQAASLAAQAALQAADKYHFHWKQWLGFYRIEYLISGVAVIALFLAAGWLLTRMFRPILERYQLVRPLRRLTLALAIYFGLFAWHPYLMVDLYDYGTIVIHKGFVAALLLVGLQLFDRLVLVMLLTRGGKLPLPRFIHQIILIVIYIFAILGYCSWAFDLNIDKFLAGSAVISIVLGLALQETLGNFFSGMVMQASSPFTLGDWISVGDKDSGVEGKVVDMTWRAVTLLTSQENHVLIPNSVIAKEQIVNYHTPTVATARAVKVGVDYDVPPNEVRAVLLRAAKETPGVLVEPEPAVGLASFDDSAITYSVVFFIDSPREHGRIESQVRTNIWYRLKEAQFNIPYPIRTVETVDLAQKNAHLNQEKQSERLAVLKKNQLFAMLTDAQRTTLAQDARDILLAAGQTVYRQGDAGDNLFILRQGTVEVLVNMPDGKEITVNTIAEGSFFGEFSTLTGQPRPTTIRAQTDIRCIEITRAHLQELFAADPALMTRISEVVTQRLADREAKLRELGAKLPADSHATHSESVLDRMKKVFDLLHLPVTQLL